MHVEWCCCLRDAVLQTRSKQSAKSMYQLPKTEEARELPVKYFGNTSDFMHCRFTDTEKRLNVRRLRLVLLSKVYTKN